MNVGQKVVCIDDRFDAVALALYTAFPVKGVTYVVRDVQLGIRTDCKTGDVSLLLVGVMNPHATSRAGLEFGFSADRFRPLSEVQEQSKSRKETERPCSIAQPVDRVGLSKAQLS